MLDFLSKSIVRRLNFSIIVILSLSLLIFTLIISYLNYQRAHDELKAKAQNYLKLAQIALVDPIWNLNQTALDDMSASFMLDEDLVYLLITDESGAPLSKANRSEIQTHSFKALRENPQYEYFYSAIVKEEGKIGEVHFLTTNRRADEIVFSSSISLILLTIVLILILDLVVTYVGYRFVKRPVADLQASAEALARGQLEHTIETGRPDELGVLARRFSDMRDAIKEKINELRHLNENLEGLVATRTVELKEALVEVEDANRHIIASIEYARLIQHNLLPSQDQILGVIPNNFIIWLPRDIVGGDFYLVERFAEGTLIMMADCTGHGVPGAFMTMIAASAMRNILHTEGVREPGEILNRLNQLVKLNLQQNEEEEAQADDGLDAAICWIDQDKKNMTFTGAKIPLLYSREGSLQLIRGDRQSLGYRNSPKQIDFTSHQIQIEPQMSFYLYSDGLIDELGGEKQFSFGNRRLIELIGQHLGQSMEDQRATLLQALWDFKGARERQDDITFLGFTFD